MKTLKPIKVFLYILLFISLCCCVPVEVILYGDISGYVTDAETSQPLDSATIELNQADNDVNSTTTNSEGSYLLENLTPGNYEITVVKPKYARETENVTVSSATTQEIDFNISKVPYPEISPPYLDFGEESISGSFIIKNVGSGILEYTCYPSYDWIETEPTSGEVSIETDTIKVSINRSSISEETQKEFIRILSFSGEEDIWDTVHIYLNGLIDEDGHYYKIVTIGTQTWMAENLNTGTIKHYAGEFVLSDNEEIEKYCYENSEANCDIYGGLYSWDEMMDYISDDEAVYNTGAGGYDFYNIQGICPAGWHIPSWDEWETLFSVVGKAEAGEKLKADSPLWEGDTIKTDEFGFGVLPGGGLFSLEQDFSNVGFHRKGSRAFIWKALSDALFSSGQILILEENIPESDFAGPPRQWSFSVRCIKDSE